MVKNKGLNEKNVIYIWNISIHRYIFASENQSLIRFFLLNDRL